MVMREPNNNHAVPAGLARVFDPGVATLAMPPANSVTLNGRARGHCARDSAVTPEIFST
jgi:hypothetical protein